MANPTVPVERYIGGGKLYYTPYENGTYGTEIEIGEVKDFTINVSSDTKEAFSKDAGIEEMVEDVTIKVDAGIKYTTQNVNKENLAMALMGSLSTETFGIGDTLPDGTVAAASVDIPKIVGLDNPTQKGKYRMVSEKINESGKKPVLLVGLATTRPTSDVGFIVDDFISLGFEGKCQKMDGSYFTEYLMDA